MYSMHARERDLERKSNLGITGEDSLQEDHDDITQAPYVFVDLITNFCMILMWYVGLCILSEKLLEV